MAESTNAAPTTKIKRIEDFLSYYANNVQFEQTAFDLKITFGELDQSGSEICVEQRAAVTIPWAQAKLMIYYLQGQVAAHELETGKIKIRNDLVPAPIPSLTPEQAKHPIAEDLMELLKTLREQFISNL